MNSLSYYQHFYHFFSLYRIRECKYNSILRLLAGVYGNKFPALYSWANTGEGKGVYLAYDDKCTFGGEKVYGNNGRNTFVPVLSTYS